MAVMVETGSAKPLHNHGLHTKPKDRQCLLLQVSTPHYSQ